MRVDGTTTSVTLTNETICKVGNPLWTGGANQDITVNYTFPTTPANGRRIELIGDHYGGNGVSMSVIQLNIPVGTEHISSGSVGTLGAYQNNGYHGNTRLVMRHGHYVCIYDSSTNAWCVSGSPTAGP